MDKNAQKRWRPVIKAIIESQTKEEALETILTLLEAPAPLAETAQPGRPTAPKSGARLIDVGVSYSPADAAALLGMSRDMLYKAIREDKLPSWRGEGDRIFIKGSDLIAYRDGRSKGVGS